MITKVRASAMERMRADQGARKAEQLLPKLLDIIFTKHPAFVKEPEEGRSLLDLHGQLSHSLYTLGVKDGKDLIAYRPKSGDDLDNIRQGAIFFANDTVLLSALSVSLGIVKTPYVTLFINYTYSFPDCQNKKIIL